MNIDIRYYIILALLFIYFLNNSVFIQDKCSSFPLISDFENQQHLPSAVTICTEDSTIGH